MKTEKDAKHSLIIKMLPRQLLINQIQTLTVTVYLQTHGVRVGQDNAKKAISFIEVIFNLFHFFHPKCLMVLFFLLFQYRDSRVFRSPLSCRHVS